MHIKKVVGSFSHHVSCSSKSPSVTHRFCFSVFQEHCQQTLNSSPFLAHCPHPSNKSDNSGLRTSEPHLQHGLSLVHEAKHYQPKWSWSSSVKVLPNLQLDDPFSWVNEWTIKACRFMVSRSKTDSKAAKNNKKMIPCKRQKLGNWLSSRWGVRLRDPGVPPQVHLEGMPYENTTTAAKLAWPGVDHGYSRQKPQQYGTYFQSQSLLETPLFDVLEPPTPPQHNSMWEKVPWCSDSGGKNLPFRSRRCWKSIYTGKHTHTYTQTDSHRAVIVERALNPNKLGPRT